MSPEEQAGLNAAESRRKDRELDLKEREVAVKEKEINTSRWSNPIVLGLFAAAIGLAGNIFVARVNNQNTQAIEHLHVQSNLVFEAIKTNGDSKAACKNLRFFVRLGLLDDANNAIRGACPSEEQGPPTISSNYNPYGGGFGEGYFPSGGGFGSGGYGRGGYGGVLGWAWMFRVKDEQDRPIESAKVNVAILQESCVTDKIGVCSIPVTGDKLPSWDSVTVEKPGYETQQRAAQPSVRTEDFILKQKRQ